MLEILKITNLPNKPFFRIDIQKKLIETRKFLQPNIYILQKEAE